MPGKIYFLEDKVYHKFGDNKEIGSTVSNTTLKLLAPKGYYNGDDTVTITNSDFIAENIKETSNIFGKQGSILVYDSAVEATTVTFEGEKLQFTAPEGFFNGAVQTFINEPNFKPENIKGGVTIFGLTGNIEGGDYELLQTGQTESIVDGDDGDTQRGLAPKGDRFLDNGDNTLTDNITGIVWIKNMVSVNSAGQEVLSAKGDWKTNEGYLVGDMVKYPPSGSVPAERWQNEYNYSVGDIVEGGDKYGPPSTFVCIMEHTSNDDNFPDRYGSDGWRDYWDNFRYPTEGDEWERGVVYNKGDVVVYTEEMGPSDIYVIVYTCLRTHTSSDDTHPRGWYGGPEESMNSPWLERNDIYVCISDHTSDIDSNHCFNSDLWVELPFSGSADNLTTNRSFYEWVKAMNTANIVEFNGSSWTIPNVSELMSILDYGVMDPASKHPGIVSGHYWTSTHKRKDDMEYDQYDIRKWSVRFSDGHTLERPDDNWHDGNNYVMLIKKVDDED